MKRRRLLGLLAGGASLSALAVGSGAFSRVRAGRSLTVDVVHDYDAYLALEPLGDGFAGLGERSWLGGTPNTVRFRFPSADEVDGNEDLGLGRDSVYRFLRDAGEGPDGTPGLLRITNQGTVPLTVYGHQPETDGPSIGLVRVGNGGEPLDPDGTETPLHAVSTLTAADGAPLDVGESIRVGFEIDTHGVPDADRYVETVAIVADADGVD